ncbi:hypothetical protein ABK040_014379 [Willaertia magna]
MSGVNTIDQTKNTTKNDFKFITNAQFVEILNLTLNQLKNKDQKQMSPRLIDIHNQFLKVIPLITQFLLVKNSGNKLQKLMKHFTKTIRLGEPKETQPRKFSSVFFNLLLRNQKMIESGQLSNDLIVIKMFKEALGNLRLFVMQLIFSRKFRTNLRRFLHTFKEIIEQKKVLSPKSNAFNNFNFNNNNNLGQKDGVSINSVSSEEVLIIEEEVNNNNSTNTPVNSNNNIRSPSESGNGTAATNNHLYEELFEALLAFRNHPKQKRTILGLFNFLKGMKQCYENENLLSTKKHYKKTMLDIQAFLEEFTTPKTINNWLEIAVNLFFKEQNEEVTKVFENIRSLVICALTDEQIDTNYYFNEIQRYINKIINMTDNNDCLALLQESVELLTRIGKDKMTINLYKELKVLVLSIASNDDITIKNQIFDEFKLIFVLFIKESLRSMDILNITKIDENESLQYFFSRTSISEERIRPTGVKIVVQEDIQLNKPTKGQTTSNKEFSAITSNSKTLIKFTISDVRGKVDSVAFWYKRNVFPYTENEGLLDISWSGMDIEIVVSVHKDTKLLSIGKEDDNLKVDVVSTKCKIAEIQCVVTRAKHFERFLQIIINLVVKHRLRKIAEKKIQYHLRQIFYPSTRIAKWFLSYFSVMKTTNESASKA